MVGLAQGNHLGNLMVGFRIQMISGTAYTNNTITFSDFTIKFQWGGAGDAQFAWMPLQMPSYQQAATIYNRFRFVAGSQLVSFFGSDLANAGQISSRLCYGGIPAPREWDSENMTFMWQMSGIGSAPRGYGPNAVKNGCYSFWLPTSEDDLILKDISDYNGFSSSQIISAGVVTSTGGSVANVIRCRWVLNYECVTTHQIIPVSESPSNPGVFKHIKELMKNKDVPTSMENDLHEQIVKWSTLPLDVINANLPLVSNVMDKAGPLLKMFKMFF
jgi:hypothetical protein